MLTAMKMHAYIRETKDVIGNLTFLPHSSTAPGSGCHDSVDPNEHGGSLHPRRLENVRERRKERGAGAFILRM